MSADAGLSRPGVSAPPRTATPPVAAGDAEVAHSSSAVGAQRGARDEDAGGAAAPGASLEACAAEVAACTSCRLHEARTQTVFGVGNPNADLMFVGEGPGAEEDRQGEPFVGPAGQLLDKIIGAMGLVRSDVYIANVVKCRPPENRTPSLDEVSTCTPFLERQIAAIRPKMIVALGRPASNFLLGCDTPVGRLRGQANAYQGIPVVVTYHPAYLLRTPSAKKDVWNDLQQVIQRLGLRPPSAR